MNLRKRYTELALIVCNTLVLLIVGHYALLFAQFLKNSLFEDHGASFMTRESMMENPVYDSLPDKATFWNDHTTPRGVNYLPYYHWRSQPMRTQTINVDSTGHRVTLKSPQRDAKKVYMYGGSTLWGAGVPDAFTIPSLLQQKLGDTYDVYNFGETGYVAAQELNYLLEQLAHGERPDIVIFYDGVNEGYAGAYSPGIPRSPHGRFRDQYAAWDPYKDGEGSILAYLYRQSAYSNLVEYLTRTTASDRIAAWDEAVASEVGSKGQAVVDIYETHITQVKALAEAYGFDVFFFWQPHLLYGTRTHLSPHEIAIVDAQRPVFVASQKSVFQAARERLADREEERIFFIAHIFDTVEAPIYIDPGHIGPTGNQLVAEVIYEKLSPFLKANTTYE